MRILALDPGQTTGVVSFTIFEDEITCVESYELDLFGTGEYLRERPFDVLVYEVANKFQASGHVSSEIIGLAKYFSGIKGSDLYPVQQSAHKRLISRDVLKRAGLYVPGGHAKDAASVGLYAAVTHLNLCRGVLRPEEAA